MDCSGTFSARRLETIIGERLVGGEDGPEAIAHIARGCLSRVHVLQAADAVTLWGCLEDVDSAFLAAHHNTIPSSPPAQPPAVAAVAAAAAAITRLGGGVRSDVGPGVFAGATGGDDGDDSRSIGRVGVRADAAEVVHGDEGMT